MGLRSYKELDAWKRAMDFVESTYLRTVDFPDQERYGLKAQMRRAAVSVPSNIAEGQARGTARFGLHFLRVAIGSIAELDTDIELARRLRFLTADAAQDLEVKLERVSQLVYGMRREHLTRLGLSAASVIAALWFSIRLLP
jgi:four helix bundle protein